MEHFIIYDSDHPAPAPVKRKYWRYQTGTRVLCTKYEDVSEVIAVRVV